VQPDSVSSNHRYALVTRECSKKDQAMNVEHEAEAIHDELLSPGCPGTHAPERVARVPAHSTACRILAHSASRPSPVTALNPTTPPPACFFTTSRAGLRAEAVSLSIFVAA
jgi:hypothetical protein